MFFALITLHSAHHQDHEIRPLKTNMYKYIPLSRRSLIFDATQRILMTISVNYAHNDSYFLSFILAISVISPLLSVSSCFPSSSDAL